MPRAVAVIQAPFPQGRPRKRVNHEPWNTLGKHERGQSNVTLENPRVALLLVICRLSKVHRSRHVCCPAVILPPGIEQKHRVWRKPVASFHFWLVMDDGTVAPLSCNRRKAWLREALLLGSELTKFLRYLVLRRRLPFPQHRNLKPLQELNKRDTIANVRLYHSTNFLLVFRRFGHRERRLLLYQSAGVIFQSDRIPQTIVSFHDKLFRFWIKEVFLTRCSSKHLHPFLPVRKTLLCILLDGLAHQIVQSGSTLRWINPDGLALVTERLKVAFNVEVVAYANTRVLKVAAHVT
mmetsp:Transcript_10725/g.20231  ORF Transcript_10725/g.20231 Transcript_10725/m.20231 type:complete len:293 (-) Transcript_10725:383-1261(-)